MDDLKFTHIATSLIDANTGQIGGVPANPRQWLRKELNKLKKSLEETPELFEARGIIVYPLAGRFIVLGGNMRLEASRELGLETVPCIVLPEGTPAEKLKEIVIKDNGSFGDWDLVALSEKWGVYLISEKAASAKEAAEKAIDKAAAEKIIKIELSDREKAIIATLE